MRMIWIVLIMCVLSPLAFADYYPPNNNPCVPAQPTTNTATTTPGQTTTFDQQMATSTAAGLKLFDQVSYQNMSSDKEDFFRSSDDDAIKHLRISGGHRGFSSRGDIGGDNGN